ncbi:MAG: hypothetical protein ACTSQG_09145 [Promethearchaeota archaeon]
MNQIYPNKKDVEERLKVVRDMIITLKKESLRIDKKISDLEREEDVLQNLLYFLNERNARGDEKDG